MEREEVASSTQNAGKDMNKLLDSYLREEDLELVRFNPSIKIYYKNLTNEAIPPTRALASSSGYDLYLPETVLIDPFSTAKVSIGIEFSFPPNLLGEIKVNIYKDLTSPNNSRTCNIGTTQHCTSSSLYHFFRYLRT